MKGLSCRSLFEISRVKWVNFWKRDLQYMPFCDCTPASNADRGFTQSFAKRRGARQSAFPAGISPLRPNREYAGETRRSLRHVSPQNCPKQELGASEHTGGMDVLGGVTLEPALLEKLLLARVRGGVHLSTCLQLRTVCWTFYRALGALRPDVCATVPPTTGSHRAIAHTLPAASRWAVLRQIHVYQVPH